MPQPVLTVFLIAAICYASPEALYAFRLSFFGPFFVLGHLFTLTVNAAKSGNPWPALIIVNLIGILTPLVIRHRRRMHTGTTAQGEVRVRAVRDTVGLAVGLVVVLSWVAQLIMEAYGLK